MEMKGLAKKNIPNYITTVRVVGTISLLFLEPLSIAFYVAYTISGFSDVLDGYLARKWKVSSAFGAKLDSIADLLFYTTMMIRILPILLKKLPSSIWIMIGIILGLRVGVYAMVAIKFKRFASIHTYLNKATGLAVFLIPYLIEQSFFVYFGWCVCVIAILAVMQEMIIHIRNKEYCAHT